MWGAVSRLMFHTCNMQASCRGQDLDRVTGVPHRCLARDCATSQHEAQRNIQGVEGAPNGFQGPPGSAKATSQGRGSNPSAPPPWLVADPKRQVHYLMDGNVQQYTYILFCLLSTKRMCPQRAVHMVWYVVCSTSA